MKDAGRIELSCSCGSEQFSYEKPLTDLTVMTCTKCGASATKGAIVKQAVKKAKPAIEKALKDAFRKGLR